MTVSGAARLLLALVVIVAVARLLGAAARRLHQPAVIGEILGGVLLGPTLFGGALTRSLFPAQVRPALSMLATVGVTVFMFLIGLELDRGLLLRGQGRIAVGVSLSSMVVPFGLGALLALYLAGQHPIGHRLAFVLFVGTAMSITAFPVLARILTDRGLLNTPIGGLALAAASLGDVLAWALLAVVAALAGAGGHPWRVLLVVPYAIVLLAGLRPLLERLAASRLADRWSGRTVGGWLVGVGVLASGAVGLWLSAAATGWMGLHPIFGAFLFGVAMPRTALPRLRARALPRLHAVCVIVLLPAFFMVAGLNVDLSSVDATDLGELGLILAVAIGGKFAGAFLGARFGGVRARHSLILAILLNTRGLTELIVLTVGLQLGALDGRLYSLMVVMALVTTAMTGVLLRLVYPPRRVAEDLGPLALRRHDDPQPAPI